MSNKTIKDTLKIIMSSLKEYIDNQLSDYAKSSDVPTRTTQLINDSGYIKSVPAEYVTESELEGYNYATKSYVDSVTPSKVSQLSNDREYITKSELNDKNYIIESDLFDYNAGNYADMDSLTDGMLHINGTVYTGSSYSRYKHLETYIPVVEGDVLTLHYTKDGSRRWSMGASAYNDSATFMRVTAYDSSKVVITSAGKESITGNYAYSYTVPSNIAFVRITLHTEFLNYVTDISIVKNATTITDYVEYGKSTISTIKAQYIPNINNNTNTDTNVTYINDTVFSAIPNSIHIAVGQEFKMYYKNVLSQYDDRLWLGYTSGIIVKKYPEYLSITATESMSKTINWKVYDNNFNVLDSGNMKVTVTDDIAKTSTVLIIGDSTVTQSNAISQKLLDCYSSSSGDLTLLGTRGTAPALHEGRAGWTSTQYCTVASNGSVVNPFYNNGFDFSYYMTQQGYSGVNVVVIQLGINDIFSMTHENFSATTTLNNLNTMINSILSYDSNIKIIVDLISVPNGNGTSFTDTYNTTQIDFVYLVNTIRLSKALIEHFEENENVTISPNNCVLDAKTDLNDGVHPNLTGYGKLGQAIYETINGIYEETDDGGESTVVELWNAGSRTEKYNTYKPATTTGTFSNDYYYYPSAYTGALSNTTVISDVAVTSNSIQFSAGSSAYGVFVPFIGLDSTKKYRFTVNPQVSGFRVYLVSYDSTGIYKNNDIIVDKTTGLTTYEFTPIEGYQQGFCFACLSATTNTIGKFTELSLIEVIE